jgi:hypothetical protein
VAMEAQLARCRELAKQYPPDGITGRNIRFLTDELERALGPKVYTRSAPRRTDRPGSV